MLHYELFWTSPLRRIYRPDVLRSRFEYQNSIRSLRVLVKLCTGSTVRHDNSVNTSLWYNIISVRQYSFLQEVMGPIRLTLQHILRERAASDVGGGTTDVSFWIRKLHETRIPEG